MYQLKVQVKDKYGNYNWTPILEAPIFGNMDNADRWARQHGYRDWARAFAI